MKKYNRKRAKINTYTHACTYTHTYFKSKIKKKGLTETRTCIKEKKYLYLIRLNVAYLPSYIES